MTAYSGKLRKCDAPVLVLLRTPHQRKVPSCIWEPAPRRVPPPTPEARDRHPLCLQLCWAVDGLRAPGPCCLRQVGSSRCLLAPPPAYRDCSIGYGIIDVMVHFVNEGGATRWHCHQRLIPSPRRFTCGTCLWRGYAHDDHSIFHPNAPSSTQRADIPVPT